MKKVFLLFFALLITSASFAQGILSLLGRSDDFFKLLEQEKFTEVYGYFDPTFQSKITEDSFKQLWGKIGEKLGKLESYQVVSSKTQGEFFTVVIEGKFTNDTQDFLLAYNKQEKIVGFFLPPKSNAASYSPPAYADTTLYKEKEINVKTAGHNLVGMLTVPKKGTNFPIVVMVHGSGPSDMDETFGPNKPLKDLAIGLAVKGIATIRYVKRTMIYPADFVGAFTVKEEVLDDAVAAVALARALPEANKKQMYLLGHSLGGMLAPRLATLIPDLNGIILLAAPARKFQDMAIEQNKYLFEMLKDTTAAGKLQLDTIVKEYQTTNITKLGTIKPDSVLAGLPASYWLDLNLYNQVEVAKKLSKRIFIGQGAFDYQVTTTDFDLWNAALGKKKNVTLKLYPDLNHMLSQQIEKGTPAQYQTQRNVSVTLVDDIAAWIKAK